MIYNRKVSGTSTVNGASPSELGSVDATLQKVANGRLIEAERVEKGSIPITTYLVYLRYAGGYFLSLFVLMTFIVNIGSTSFSSWWLAHWLHVGVAVVKGC